MLITVLGRNLPGLACGGATNVHVALQVGPDPVGPVRGDVAEARWDLDVRRVDRDLRGPAVHGRRGDRFLYLTWGDVTADGTFTMFRRAKLMLNRVDPALLDRADAAGLRLVATVDLTDARGLPRCARVDPPAIVWSVG